MTNGKKKLSYGSDPEDAYSILEMRLLPEELDLIVKNEFVKILQRDLQTVVEELG
jgi:hypothetical protein